MNLLPLQNSYVTLEEANEFLAGETLWEGLEVAEKERNLLTATRHIDGLLLCGEKADSSQILAFPRKKDGAGDMDMTPIFTAQMLEALFLSDRQISQRRRLQEQGVKAISIGSTSESYDNENSFGLLSKEAEALLRPWLFGGFPIT